MKYYDVKGEQSHVVVGSRILQNLTNNVLETDAYEQIGISLRRAGFTVSHYVS